MCIAVVLLKTFSLALLVTYLIEIKSFPCFPDFGLLLQSQKWLLLPCPCVSFNVCNTNNLSEIRFTGVIRYIILHVLLLFDWDDSVREFYRCLIDLDKMLGSRGSYWSITWNVGQFPPDYTVEYFRRQISPGFSINSLYVANGVGCVPTLDNSYRYYRYISWHRLLHSIKTNCCRQIVLRLAALFRTTHACHQTTLDFCFVTIIVLIIDFSIVLGEVGVMRTKLYKEKVSETYYRFQSYRKCMFINVGWGRR